MRKQSIDRDQQHILRNEQGYVLVVALLALFVTTVIGVLALSTSTTEVMVAGNTRLREISLSAADAGIEIADPVMRNPDATKYPFIVDEPTLQSEIFCVSQLNPDGENFRLNGFGGNTDVSVDIDYINAGDPSPGYALEEGGLPILKKYFVINSTSTGPTGSEGVIGAPYYLVGYCE